MNKIIPVNNQLCLRPFTKVDDLTQALTWYQDSEMVYLVDGVREPYSMEKLQRMYAYLHEHGQLFWIEYLTTDGWKAIGDVTWCEDDLPIVIGYAAYRGHGIGKAVLAVLIEKARSEGKSYLKVGEIYSYNLASQALFESCGFEKIGQTEKGFSYRLNLT